MGKGTKRSSRRCPVHVHPDSQRPYRPFRPPASTTTAFLPGTPCGWLSECPYIAFVLRASLDNSATQTRLAGAWHDAMLADKTFVAG